MLTLSPPAAVKVHELLVRETLAAPRLRVAVRPGGCSGFSYEMFFDDVVGEHDTVYESNGVNLVVDAESASLLTDAVLEYSDGLQGAGFKVTNPSASRTCGCGQSFS